MSFIEIRIFFYVNSIYKVLLKGFSLIEVSVIFLSEEDGESSPKRLKLSHEQFHKSLRYD